MRPEIQLSGPMKGDTETTCNVGSVNCRHVLGSPEPQNLEELSADPDIVGPRELNVLD